MAIAKKRLKVAVREPGGSLELGIKPGRSAGVVDDKVWVPEGSGDVRGRIRWKIARIDRDLESVSLQQSRGRETDDATAQYCDRASPAARGDLFDGEIGRAPGQRHAGAAVSVVVNEQLVAERLGPNDEARGAKRTKSDVGADDPVRGDENPSEPAFIAVGVKAHRLVDYSTHSAQSTAP